MAAVLFAEESWRDQAPAALVRLARLHERAGRAPDAVRCYLEFLSLWSGADAQLAPVVAAREAIGRLK